MLYWKGVTADMYILYVVFAGLCDFGICHLDVTSIPAGWPSTQLPQNVNNWPLAKGDKPTGHDTHESRVNLFYFILL